MIKNTLNYLLTHHRMDYPLYRCNHCNIQPGNSDRKVVEYVNCALSDEDRRYPQTEKEA